MKMKAKISTIIVSFMMIAIMCVAVPIIVDDSSAEPSTELDTVYVSNTGNDSNTGEESKPVKTFAKAVSLVKENGIIYVVDDSVDGHETSISKPLSIIGINEDSKIKIKKAFVFNGVNGKILFKNLDICGTGLSLQELNNETNLELELENCNLSTYINGSLKSLTVKKCVIDPSEAISEATGWYLINVNSNVIHVEQSTIGSSDSSKGCKGAIHLGDSQTGPINATIKNNIIKNVERGIQLANKTTASKEIIIEGNTFIGLDNYNLSTNKSFAAIFIHENLATNTQIVIVNNTIGKDINILSSEHGSLKTEEYIKSMSGNSNNRISVLDNTADYKVVKEDDKYITVKLDYSPSNGIVTESTKEEATINGETVAVEKTETTSSTSSTTEIVIKTETGDELASVKQENDVTDITISSSNSDVLDDVVNLVKDPNSEINITVESTTGDSVILDSSNITVLKNNNASLSISNSDATVTLDKDVISNISTDLSIKIEEVSKSSLTAEQKAVVGNNKVISIDATSGNTKIHMLGGTALITIPYVGANSNTEVYYVAEDGSLEKLYVESYTDKDITVKTTHFSDFMVGSPVSNSGSSGSSTVIIQNQSSNSGLDPNVAFLGMIFVLVITIFGFAYVIRK